MKINNSLNLIDQSNGNNLLKDQGNSVQKDDQPQSGSHKKNDHVDISKNRNNKSDSSLITYTGHGMLESYPKNQSITYVVAHELRHAQHNRMMAFAKGEEVDQKITYSLSFVDGKLQANGGVTQSTFTKNETEKKQLSMAAPDKSSPQKQKFKGATDITQDNQKFITLKKNKKRLENELSHLKRKTTGKKNIDGLTQELPYEQKAEIEQIKHKIGVLTKEIEQKKRGTQKITVLSPSSKGLNEIKNTKTPINKDFITIRNISDLYTKSFSFIEGKTPQVTLLDSAFSGLTVQNALSELKTIKPAHPIEINSSHDTRIPGIKLNALGDLQETLNALRISSQELSSPTSFTDTKSISLDNDIVSALTTIGASPKTLTITPATIFSPHRVVSDISPDPFSSLNLTGTFKINGFDISIDTSSSLSDIVNKINFGEDINNNGSLDLTEDLNGNGNLDILTIGTGENKVIVFEDIDSDRILDPSEDLNNNKRIDGGSSQIGVSATIENNQLILTGTTFSKINLSDKDNILQSLGVLTTNINSATVLKHNNTTNVSANTISNQEPKLAELTVNKKEFTRKENTISDIIPGVTITLKKSSHKPVSVTIKKDISQSFNLINNFVETFNKSISFINDQLEFKQTLKGDPDIQRIRKNLIQNTTKKVNPSVDKKTPRKVRSLFDAGIKQVNTNKRNINELQITNLLKEFKSDLKSAVSPVTGSESIFSHLGSMGILSHSDDTLSIDEGRLKTVLENNIKDISNLFTNTADGISIRLKKQLDKILNIRTGTVHTKKEAIVNINKNQNNISMIKKEFVQTVLGNTTNHKVLTEALEGSILEGSNEPEE